jgi:DNA-binding SARP family transcriptional activator/tetratricopeptide (TPR) repeat protein
MPIFLHFLGEPFVETEGRRVEIPLKKAEAALFFTAFEGETQRNRLKSLLWGDKDEEQAAGNLRNTIYVLRKILPQHFIANRQKLFLKDFRTDLSGVSGLSNPTRPIDPIYFDEPLRGFDMLELPDLDDWLMAARACIKKDITERLRERIAACYEKALHEELTEALSALLTFEPYDEDSMLELMEAWRDKGCIAKAVSVYNAFQKRMDAEIGVSPSGRAHAYFKKLVSSNSEVDDLGNPGEFFCCREAEIEKISDALRENKKNLMIILIHGEAGVGKTALVSRALKLNIIENTDVFAARPHSVGEKYPYSSWNGIVIEMGKKLEERKISLDRMTISVLSGIFYDFLKDANSVQSTEVQMTSDRSPVMISHMLVTALRALCPNERPVFIFEDLHWFDPRSLSLMQAFLSEISTPATIFLTSRPEGASSVRGLIYGIKTAMPRKFVQIELSPFSLEETMRFCRVFLPEEVISRKDKDYFQSRSEGIPLLIVEMLRILSENPDADCSSGLKGVLMSRMEDISALQRGILSVLSVFGIGASIEDIASVMNTDENGISKSIESLLDKKLICEIQSDREPLLDFLHPNVRECVYNSIPGFKKRRLHRGIAELLGSRYSLQVWNPSLGETMRRHCAMAGMRIQALKQYLAEVNFYVLLNHDLFPMVEDRILLSCRVPFSNREDTEYKFNQVLDLLHDINAETYDSRTTESKRIEASYLEIRGGYLISWGEYQEGKVFIKKALKIAKENGFDEIRLHCLEHMGHHFLQTDEGPRLLFAGRELLRLSNDVGMETHKGMALRFIGMSMLLKGDFERAERVFRRSIDIFEELSLTGRNYTLNLLASQCYIGEMRQWRGDLDSAMEHFESCVKRCEEMGLFWGRSHFHAHAADTALDMEDWELVNKHVDAGGAFFDIRRGGRCSSMLYSLKAICDARRGKFSEAMESLRQGEVLSSIGKKTWRSAQLFACAWIAQMRENHEAAIPCDGFLTRSSNFYAQAAETLYRDMRAARRADLIREKFRL